MNSLRTKIVQKLVHLNEGLFFYPKLRRFYKSVLKSRPVRIIDVGANKGQSIAFFLDIDPAAEIDAFEPNASLYESVRNKYKAQPAIRLHNVGASNIDGELEFLENLLDETSTFEPLNYDSDYLIKKAKILGVKPEGLVARKYKVPVVRLCDFLRGKEGIIDVLKIDVEGHELSVLQGLFAQDSQNCPLRFIQLEQHNHDMYKSHDTHRIDPLLNENGFREVARIKHAFGDFAEIIYKNQNL